MERNILVYVKGFPKTPIEFELSRNEHMKEMPGRAFTVTALFKEPPPHLHAEAWRILMYVVSGKELMPVLAQKYCREALARETAKRSRKEQIGGREGIPETVPGSASSATAKSFFPFSDAAPTENVSATNQGSGSASPDTGGSLRSPSDAAPVSFTNEPVAAAAAVSAAPPSQPSIP